MKALLLPAAGCSLLVAASATASAKTAPPIKATVSTETPSIKGAEGILVDASTGQVLWSKNAHKRLPMASTTKVMTVLLALERGKLNDVVTAPKGIEEIPESSLHLIPGEKMSLHNLLCAAMVRSANDAAVVVANHIGGCQEKFVEMMNARACQLGLKNTQFKNPNGLNVQGHYSSAFDLAVLARQAVKHPEFNQLCSIRKIVLDRTASPDKLLRNHARFLWQYKGADGIKTGYTRQAGRCFIGSATKDGWRLISVVLKSSDAGNDTRVLMDYGFKNYKKVILARAGSALESVPVPGGRPDRLTLTPQTDLAVCLRKDEKPAPLCVQLTLPAVPIRKGEVVGSLMSPIPGKTPIKVALVAASDIQVLPPSRMGFLLTILALPMGYALFRVTRRGAL